MNCENCRWWLRADKKTKGKQVDLAAMIEEEGGHYLAGFCIRFPPSFSFNGKRAGWVVTRPNDFCGEHKSISPCCVTDTVEGEVPINFL